MSDQIKEEIKEELLVALIRKMGPSLTFHPVRDLGDLTAETPLPVLLPAVLKSMVKSRPGLMTAYGITLLVRRGYNQKKLGCIYLASCAEEILEPKQAKKLLNDLKSFNEPDVLSRKIRTFIGPLEDTLKEKNLKAILLAEDRTTRQPGVFIPVVGDDRIALRENGEILFPLPQSPGKKKSTAPAAQPA